MTSTEEATKRMARYHTAVRRLINNAEAVKEHAGDLAGSTNNINFKTTIEPLEISELEAIEFELNDVEQKLLQLTIRVSTR